MTTILKYARWLGWSLWYLPRPSPKEFQAYIRKVQRTWEPWRKFKPNAYHNHEMRYWEIHLKDCGYYVSRETVRLEVHRAFDTKEIVGFTVWDEHLTPPEKVSP